MLYFWLLILSSSVYSSSLNGNPQLTSIQGEAKRTLPNNIVYQQEGRFKRDLQMQDVTPGSNRDILLQLLARRSCFAWKQSGFTSSGNYTIDPDGREVGLPPFQVYCDMDTNSTFVHHDSEGEQHVDGCSGPGCFNRSINYHATEQQILALMKVSESCQQSIQLRCRQPQLKKDEVASWWVDRHGDRHDYWSGSIFEGHRCACRESESCGQEGHACNCNTSMGDAHVTDQGYFTNTSTLPVKGLYFGETSGNLINLYFTLGPLRCSGERHVVIPESCEDVWMAGNMYNGYYFLGKGDNVRLQLCTWETIVNGEVNQASPTLQLTSLVHNTRFQQFSEQVNDSLKKINTELDILGTTVSFNAYLTEDKPDVISTFLKFNSVTVNIGGGYNNDTGMFTAPISGLYMFSISIWKSFRSNTRADIRKNGLTIAIAYSHLSMYYNVFSTTVVTELVEGDNVGVYLRFGSVDLPNSLFLGVLLHT